MDRLYMVLIISCLLKYAVTERNETKCEGSTKCIPLPACVPYMKLIVGGKKPLRPSIVKFLKAHECGFENEFPSVCCKVLPTTYESFKFETTTSPKDPVSLKIPLPTRRVPFEFALEDNQQPKSTNVSKKDVRLNLNNTDIIDRENQHKLFKLYSKVKAVDLTTTHKPTTLSEEFKKWKSYQLNLQFSDMLEPFYFDLYRKKRRADNNDVDIEIR